VISSPGHAGLIRSDGKPGQLIQPRFNRSDHLTHWSTLSTGLITGSVLLTLHLNASQVHVKEVGLFDGKEVLLHESPRSISIGYYFHPCTGDKHYVSTPTAAELW